MKKYYPIFALLLVAAAILGQFNSVSAAPAASFIPCVYPLMGSGEKYLTPDGNIKEVCVIEQDTTSKFYSAWRMYQELGAGPIMVTITDPVPLKWYGNKYLLITTPKGSYRIDLLNPVSVPSTVYLVWDNFSHQYKIYGTQNLKPVTPIYPAPLP